MTYEDALHIKVPTEKFNVREGTISATLKFEWLDIAFDTLEKIIKLKDLTEGTIDHFDRDDAMDMLYEVKEIVEDENGKILQENRKNEPR